MDKEALIKVAKGAIIAALGAGLTYLTAHLTDAGIPAEWLPAVTAGFGIALNALRKWFFG